ncbi:Alkylphosphonate ABC transporter, substrate-binding protein (PhnD) [Metamycoplasma auris 15026]|uniref:Alkylphosphonate ABC transporter, substrate-binding protein (PhnD) n=1 Tax=Metamycoplasma auris 15026 TaxID=1188233 RepID=N9TSV7_9BACT|nr:alkylphosphonate ABC transporter substrate-binding protein (PhnD) [Metamycoplasma auris]ENY69155.1 Alkylphosphonate ABC transporter, substrate-binding protein (PhnD) [Metamycoplasma auris 15026]
MKKLNLFMLSAALVSLPLVAASCNTKKELKFAVNAPWSGKKDGHEFFKLLTDEFNKKTNGESSFSVSYVGENTDVASTIAKGSHNIAVITTPLYVKQYKNKHMDNVIPILQTATKAFKFDADETKDIKYKDGKEDDPLRLLAKEAHKLFAEKKYGEWTDKEYKWNGSIYQKFYDDSKIVPYYRGLVMIHGDEQTRKQIKEAWESKDWEKFRDFGIVTSSEDSGSKYIWQEALFRKHFGKNKFESFKKDKLKANDKYITSGNDVKPRNIGQGAIKQFHIVFDDLGSFAYTNNSIGKHFYTPEDNSQIEFLTATEKIPYNVIAVDKKMFNEKEIAALQDVFVNLAKENKDDYGPIVGFNGYIKINDLQKEVIDPYNEVFKD